MGALKTNCLHWWWTFAGVKLVFPISYDFIQISNV